MKIRSIFISTLISAGITFILMLSFTFLELTLRRFYGMGSQIIIFVLFLAVIPVSYVQIVKLLASIYGQKQVTGFKPSSLMVGLTGGLASMLVAFMFILAETLIFHFAFSLFAAFLFLIEFVAWFVLGTYASRIGAQLQHNN